MAKLNKREYTPRVPREGGDENIFEPKLAPNHKRTSANSMCNDIKLGNFHCVVLLDDISSLH